MRARFRLTPLLTALSLAAPGAWAGTVVVATSGQAAPGLAGVSFQSFFGAALDDAGRVSFASVLAGGGVGTGNDSSIWRAGVLQAREGQAAPGLPAGTLLGELTPRGTTPGGALTYSSRLTGPGITGANDSAVWRDATVLARTGDPAPGAGTGAAFVQFSVLAFDAQGAALTRATLTGSGVTSANDEGLWMGGTLLAREGSTAPGSGSAVFASSPFGSMSAAGNGRYAYRARLAGTDVTSANDIGIWRNGGLLVREGQAAGGMAAGTTIASLESNGNLRTVNADGQVLYWAQTAGTVATTGLWLDGNPVVLAGSAAPGAPGATFTSFGYHALNDAGQAVWAATLSSGGNGYWRDGQAIVRSGDVLASGRTVSIIGLSPFAPAPALAPGGQVLAWAALTDGGTALTVGDGSELHTVLESGAAVAGSTVVNLSSTQINRHGQVAWNATLADGTQAVGLWTPDLRWRTGGSGSWDQAANWTLSLAPGQPHSVRIDPGIALTVTGPAGSAAVDSLVVGGGTGFATLRLGGGRIDSAQGVTVAAKGILTGSGTIGSLVRNRGEVRADSLVLEAGLLNEGFVRGSTSGGQRIDAALTNTASGWVQVRPGERLLLAGPAHENGGTFDLQGGELQLRGRLKNSAGGRILMDDARLYAFDGIENSGQIQVTFGESEVFGAIATTATGKILLSGNSQTTFYDALDVKSGGELRVSSGAAAVFFGAVQQRSGAVFSGTGQRYYEGGLSIGGSPGLGLDAGNVAFGAGNLYLAEIGGLAAGTEFDAYRVAGHLDFGGTLALVSWEGFTGQAGQRFDLFDWGSASGAFASIDADGFALAAGTTLDLSRLYTDGSIAVVAVPEPGTWALMLGGALVLGLRRRRACGNPPTARGGA